MAGQSLLAHPPSHLHSGAHRIPTLTALTLYPCHNIPSTVPLSLPALHITICLILYHCHCLPSTAPSLGHCMLSTVPLSLPAIYYPLVTICPPLSHLLLSVLHSSLVTLYPLLFSCHCLPNLHCSLSLSALHYPPLITLCPPLSYCHCLASTVPL